MARNFSKKHFDAALTQALSGATDKELKNITAKLDKNGGDSEIAQAVKDGVALENRARDKN